MIGTTFLVALIGFGAFGVIHYLNNREATKTDLNASENLSTAEYIVAEQKNEGAEERKSDEGEKTDTDTEPEVVDLKEAAEAAETKKEVARNNAGLKVAEPKITFAGADEDSGNIIIAAEITNVLDESGECTFEVTNGNAKKVFTQDILPNAKNSVCDAVVLEKDSDEYKNTMSELGAGEWTVQLKYKSNYSEGESEKVKFKVN